MLQKANEQRAANSLQNKIRYNGQIMTGAEYIKALYNEGYRPEIGQKPQIEFNRTKYNKMDGWQQEEYEKKCNTMIPCYKAVKGGTSFLLSKAEFDYMQSI